MMHVRTPVRPNRQLDEAIAVSRRWDAHNAAIVSTGASAASQQHGRLRLRRQSVVTGRLSDEDFERTFLAPIEKDLRKEYGDIFQEERTKLMEQYQDNPLTRAELETWKKGFWAEADRIIEEMLLEDRKKYRPLL